MRLTKLYFTFALLLYGITAESQNFAVQATVQIVPPYSVYLSDYATGGVDKLRVILIQKDLSRSSYQLRLVMSVELNGKIIMRTSRFFNPSPITLDAGIPTVISGAELEPYVNSRNIDFIGYDKNLYEKTKSLPEGSYRIIFTAYDYHRQDQQVSNEGSGYYYLAKNEPPLINYPACGAKIPLKTPQQIAFSWMPRNTSSPNSAQETEYEFALYETRPVGRNPNDVVLTAAPVYRIRTDNTQLLYSQLEPLLLENMTYVWRVQAIDRSGRDAFRNNGYSEVCTFTYGGLDASFDIGIVKGLQAIGETDTRGKISWEKGNFDSYKVYYKKSGSGYEWFTNEVTNTEFKIFDLEADKEYEVRVQAKKSGAYSPYTDIIKFRTREKLLVSCGDPAIVPNGLGNPLTMAMTGMVITASGIPVVLLEVSSTGQPGWYKGIGTVVLPYLGASYHVKFDRLYIDENREAKEGRMDVATEGIEKWIKDNVVTHQDLKDQQQQENQHQWEGTVFYDKVFKYDIDIAQIIVDPSGNLIITQEDGKTSINNEVPAILVNAPEKAVIIQDKNGDQYVVQKDKTTGETKVTKVEGGGLSASTTTAQPDPIKDRIVVIILEQFEEEIAAWLRINGKGGEEDDEVLLALAMPVCLKKDAGQLRYMKERIIPYYKEHSSELREAIEANQSRKTLFDRIAGLFENKDNIDWLKITADDQETLRDGACEALANDIEPLVSFYEKAEPILIGDEFEKAMKEIKAIYEFFKGCNDEGWKTYDGDGIIPYCFWRDQNVSSSLYYSNADLPFTSGLIDGVYNEAEGIYHLPELIKDLSKIPNKLIFAYVLYSLKCSPENLVANAKELDYVLDQLAEQEKESGIINGIINSALEFWRNYEGKKEDLLEYFKECNDAKELREEVKQLTAIISSLDEIKKLYSEVSQRISAYLNTLEKADNIGRYKRGRLVVPVVSTVLTLGAAAVPKMEELKNVLRSLKEASEGNWKKVTEGIGKLVAKNADDVIDLVKAEQRYTRTYASSTTKPFGLQMSLDEVERVYGVNGKKIVQAVEKKAKEIIAETGGNIQGDPVLTGLIDSKTGRIFYGRNLSDPAELKQFIEDLHPILKKRLELHQSHINDNSLRATADDIRRAAMPGSHSEIVALDQALKARGATATEADLADFIVHNRKLGTPLDNVGIPQGCPPRCAHCWFLSDDIKVIGND